MIIISFRELKLLVTKKKVSFSMVMENGKLKDNCIGGDSVIEHMRNSIILKPKTFQQNNIRIYI